MVHMDTSITQYFGRNTPLNAKDNENVTAALAYIERLAEDIGKLSMKTDAWNELKEELQRTHRSLRDNSVEQFQLEILMDAVLPYIRDVKSRYLQADTARYTQIQTLLGLLSPQTTSSHVNSDRIETTEYDHPAVNLLLMDKVLCDIKRQRVFFPSKLGILLEKALKRQWSPILRDNQRGLRSVGSRLIALGLVEAIGRPIMLLYPIYLVSHDSMNLIRDIEAKKKPSTENLVRLIKIAAVLIACANFLSILAAYTGLGYTCITLGCGCLVISASDELSKSAVPIIAPYLRQLDVIVGRVYEMERSVMSTLARRERPNEEEDSSGALEHNEGAERHVQEIFTAGLRKRVQTRIR